MSQCAVLYMQLLRHPCTTCHCMYPVCSLQESQSQQKQKIHFSAVVTSIYVFVNPNTNAFICICSEGNRNLRSSQHSCSVNVAVSHAVTNLLQIIFTSVFRLSQMPKEVQTFWGASSPLCWFNNKEFLCITHTAEHNYISPSSTVGIQLHVSALYVGQLQVLI